MPTIYNLNQPPHPFWDFVANIEDHPFFGGYARPPPYASGDDVNPEQQQQQEEPAQETEKAAHQPSVEDDPNDQEAPRYRGIGENPDHKDKAEPENIWAGERDMPFRGRHGGRRGCRHGHGGPPSDGEGTAPRHHHRGGHGGGRGGPEGRGRGGFGGGWGRGGFGGFGGFGGRGGPFWMGPPGPHGPHRRGGPHGHPRGPPHGGPNGFQLPDFLQDLGERLGLDLSSAADSLAGTRGAAATDSGVDFEPRADVFDTKTAYIVHASLPGAHKSDVGVEWDAENSTLRITGVVHRPGADEELLAALAVDGRKREVGVFEKAIVLGTRRSPANIVVENIKAKMQEGVLVITVPKKDFEKTEIHIGSESPVGEPVATNDEKEFEMDSETEKGDHEAEMDVDDHHHHNEKADYEVEEAEVEHEKEEREHQAMQHEDAAATPDHSDEEGEYVRIDVD